MSKLSDGHWFYNPKTREWVQIAKIRSFHNVIEGEPVICSRGGEVLDFGQGPIRVSDSFEKARVLRQHGLMPSPGGNLQTSRYEPDKAPKFDEFFYKEHGIALQEAANSLVHVKEE